MGEWNVRTKEIGANNEGIEVTFQCSKEVLTHFNGNYSVSTAWQFGEMLLREITEVLNKNNAGLV